MTRFSCNSETNENLQENIEDIDGSQKIAFFSTLNKINCCLHKNK